MIRTWYTAASGMLAQQDRLDVISNNLANADTTGFKRDQAIQKAFPELLIRRTEDQFIQIPASGEQPLLGSVDTMPVVGKLGSGVEVNEIFTDFSQGSLKATGNDFDMALEGEGFFTVMTPGGERLTRNGGFHLGVEGMLMTKEGFPVMGENGPIYVKQHNFTVDRDGNVFQNAARAFDEDLVDPRTNQWEETVLVDRIKIVDVEQPRYLEKQGGSLWATTEYSGQAQVMDQGRPGVRQQFIETSNINVVNEMVRMIEVQRAYEANQKTIQAGDQTVDKLVNGALRV